MRQFRWHEKFHGIRWNSMELGVCQFRWQEHGIPWNFGCANFDDSSSSMEFHGTLNAPISLTRAVPWNSMEFHGTLNAPISLTREVPWNSMEFHGTRSVPISMTRAVSWNSMEFYGTLCGTAHIIEIGGLLVPWNSMEFHWTARVSENGVL